MSRTQVGIVSNRKPFVQPCAVFFCLLQLSSALCCSWLLHCCVMTRHTLLAVWIEALLCVGLSMVCSALMYHDQDKRKESVMLLFVSIVGIGKVIATLRTTGGSRAQLQYVQHETQYEIVMFYHCATANMMEPCLVSSTYEGDPSLFRNAENHNSINIR